jgi:alpha-1,3-rhamnosyl/mannosyltransferase
MRSDVVLDVPHSRHASVGMRQYMRELALRLPKVAPDLKFDYLVRTTSLDLGEQVGAALALYARRARLVHHTAFYAPLLGPRPSIVTVHDLIHLRFPEYHKRSVVPYYHVVVRGLCARAARVITDDERTIEDLERYLGVDARKVRVIPLGAEETYLQPVAAAQAERPYFVYAGNHRGHKDLPTLFAAWEAMDPSYCVDLAITGHDDLSNSGALPARANGRLRFLGDLSTRELASAFAGSIALVHPALCEGFGLPMLEAACVGARVIACSDAVPKVLRPFVDVFAPRDARTLVGLMENAFRTPAPSPELARVARSLTWDRCAERTAEVYRDVLRETVAAHA